MMYSASERYAFSAMQARLIDLLLRRDSDLFKRYYSEHTGFLAAGDSALEQMREFGVLFYLRDELFEHILPRIVRRLSFASPRSSTIEEPPAHGRINWERTLAASWSEHPGEAPLSLHTQLRRRDFATPENLLTVATLLEYRADIQALLWNDSETNSLQALRHPLAAIAERCERELAFLQFAHLRSQVELLLEREGSAALEEAVSARDNEGNSAYHDLLAWRERRRELRLLDRQAEDDATATLGADPARDNYLYQIWLFYELLDMLETHGRVVSWQAEGMRVHFRWNERTYELAHDRAIPPEGILWQNAPGVRPDFLVTHADRRELRDEAGQLIWQEMGYVLDAKYYRPIGDDPKNPSGPIKRMIADLQLTGQRYGALLFAFHGSETSDEEAKKRIRPAEQTAQYIQPDLQIMPLRLHPSINTAALHEKLAALLNSVDGVLSERVAIACHALAFEPLLANAHGMISRPTGLTTRTGAPIDGLDDLVLCPKPHVAAWRVDLVSRTRDCCANSALCHIKHLPGARKPERLGTLEDIISALRPPPGETGDSEQLIEAATAHVLAVTKHYAQLLQPNIAHYRAWMRNRLDIGSKFEKTPLLSDTQRETLALGRFLWEQIEHIQASNFAGPVLLFTGVLEEAMRTSVFPHIAVLEKSGHNKKSHRPTLGTLGKSKKHHSYISVEQELRDKRLWNEQHAVKFSYWIDLLDTITDIRNQAAHEAHVDNAAFEKLTNAYFGSVRMGLGVLNGLLLAWRTDAR